MTVERLVSGDDNGLIARGKNKISDFEFYLRVVPVVLRKQKPSNTISPY
jgi:hypothetical protein